MFVPLLLCCLSVPFYLHVSSCGIPTRLHSIQSLYLGLSFLSLRVSITQLANTPGYLRPRCSKSRLVLLFAHAFCMLWKAAAILVTLTYGMQFDLDKRALANLTRAGGMSVSGRWLLSCFQTIAINFVIQWPLIAAAAITVATLLARRRIERDLRAQMLAEKLAASTEDEVCVAVFCSYCFLSLNVQMCGVSWVDPRVFVCSLPRSAFQRHLLPTLEFPTRRRVSPARQRDLRRRRRGRRGRRRRRAHRPGANARGSESSPGVAARRAVVANLVAASTSASTPPTSAEALACAVARAPLLGV